MTGKIVFLVEDRSMKELIEGLLPRLFPDMSFICISHDGKSHLERSVPRKLRAWREPGVRFVVMRDKDRSDCVETKRNLARMCADAGRPDTLVRIVCEELEAWYLGDPDALADAFGDEKLRGIGRRARFRDPDTVRQPSSEVSRLAPEFQKTGGARKMAQFLSRERNASRSFQVLMSGLDRILAET